jgi:hypothetical protein
MRWTPTFMFGPAGDVETLALRLPVGLWRHGGPTKGIWRATATGIPGVTFTNRKRVLIVPVRFYEDEWPAVRRLVEWGQGKNPFVWIPESDPYSTAGAATVYLESPKIIEVVQPTPDPQFPRVSSIVMSFRQIVIGAES